MPCIKLSNITRSAIRIFASIYLPLFCEIPKIGMSLRFQLPALISFIWANKRWLVFFSSSLLQMYADLREGECDVTAMSHVAAVCHVSATVWQSTIVGILTNYSWQVRSLGEVYIAPVVQSSCFYRKRHYFTARALPRDKYITELETLCL